nr:DUF4244 domain-containing protein [Haloglycomyces albus]
MSILDSKISRPQPHHRSPRPRARAVRRPGVVTRALAQRLRGERGMSTAEYAVGTLAAVAFAGLLLNVLTSGAVEETLQGLIQDALQ